MTGTITALSIPSFITNCKHEEGLRLRLPSLDASLHWSSILAVGLYSDSTEGPLMLLTALDSGITHMVFAEDGNHLYTGFRKVCKLLKRRSKDDW